MKRSPATEKCDHFNGLTSEIIQRIFMVTLILSLMVSFCHICYHNLYKPLINQSGPKMRTTRVTFWSRVPFDFDNLEGTVD